MHISHMPQILIELDAFSIKPQTLNKQNSCCMSEYIGKAPAHSITDMAMSGEGDRYIREIADVACIIAEPIMAAYTAPKRLWVDMRL